MKSFACFRGIFAALSIMIAGAAVSSPPKTAEPWWRGAVLYEIYPRSFQDSDGDGLGDLNGITQRLGHLQELGVDAIWIAPMYPSPDVDFGYDISDHAAIDPRLGTLADFDRLVREAKRRNIRVLADLVMNHTSDQHQWFVRSRSSRANPYAAWYIWHDGKRRGSTARPSPPNNWLSTFGGSAWQWSPERKQYYYHEFYRAQPDLNWRNPAVERAFFKVVDFWLDRGVDGFRLDAVSYIFEDPLLRDNPAAPGGGINAQGDPMLIEYRTENQPGVIDLVRRLRQHMARRNPDSVLVGEASAPGADTLAEWYGGPALDALHLPMNLDLGFTRGFNLDVLRRKLVEAQTLVHGGQPLLVFDNHDGDRSIDRFGDGRNDDAIAKVIAALALTPRATALLYQGQEIGMRTWRPTRREQVRDPIGRTGWPKDKGRDGSRTPMQWSGAKNAGFSAADATWLPVNPNYRTVNVGTQADNPMSLFSWHRRLIALRRQHPALLRGAMTFTHPDHPAVLAFERRDPASGDVVAVALSFSPAAQTIAFGSPDQQRWCDLASSAGPSSGVMADREIRLAPFEVRLLVRCPAR